MRQGPAPTIWTTRRKWAGNLAPLPFLFFPFGCGAALFGAGQHWLGGALAVSSIPLGWVGLNLLGGTGSDRMRRDLARILLAKGEKIDAATPFVGFATPAFRSGLDAHEDVGFVFLDRDRLRFRSETRETAVAKKGITAVGHAPNLHSILGVGRWTTVEGTEDGIAYRLFFEPRTEPTMRANRRAGADLRERIERWRTGR